MNGGHQDLSTEKVVSCCDKQAIENDFRFSSSAEFRVVQHQRDEQITYRMQKLFGFGNVVVNQE